MNPDPPMELAARNILIVDESKCIGCHSCDMACGLEHNLDSYVHLVRVIQTERPKHNGDTTVENRIIKCLHCDNPGCVESCPTGAMQKREDGIVFSDPEACIGCRTCAYACPFGIPQLNQRTGKIAKCDGCKDRVDAGFVPRCVEVCPTSALNYGPAYRIVRSVNRNVATRIARTFNYEGT